MFSPVTSVIPGRHVIQQYKGLGHEHSVLLAPHDPAEVTVCMDNQRIPIETPEKFITNFVVTVGHFAERKNAAHRYVVSY